VQRIWAIAACVIVLVPLCAFAISRGLASSPERVVVAATNESSVATTSTRPAPSSVVTTPRTSPPTTTIIVPPRQTVITRQIPPVTTVTYTVIPQAVPTTAAPLTTVTIPAPTTTATTIPKSKPCVHSTQAIPTGGTVPVPVGPAPTKMVVRDLQVGTGAVVKTHTTLTVEYVAVACSTGKIIDASYQHGGTSTLKLDEVIIGWQLGMPGARVGGTRLLGVPAAYAYGLAGRPPIIGPNEALWFQVKVIATNVTIGVPGAPTNVHATPSTASAVLSWTVPPNNGAAVTQYLITTYVNGNVQGQQSAYTTASQMTMTGLTPGTAYTFKIAARNSYGTGPQSVASNSVIPT
jgi:peptidylprolyl isomerase